MSEKDNVRSVAFGSDQGVVAQKQPLARSLEGLGYRVVAMELQ